MGESGESTTPARNDPVLLQADGVGFAQGSGRAAVAPAGARMAQPPAHADLAGEEKELEVLRKEAARARAKARAKAASATATSAASAAATAASAMDALPEGSVGDDDELLGGEDDAAEEAARDLIAEEAFAAGADSGGEDPEQEEERMVGAQVDDDEDLFGAGFLDPPDDGHDDWEIPAGGDLEGDAAAASAEPLEIPMAVIPPSAAPRVAPRAAPRTAAVAMGMPCGVVRFCPNTGTLVAQTTALAPEPAFLTRTLAASRVAARAGQGRPVGLLMVWLLHVDVAMGRDAHVHHGPSAQNFQRRSEARLAFEAMDDPARDAILCAERGRRPGEGSEPFDIP